MEKLKDQILKADRLYDFGSLAVGDSFILKGEKARYMIFSSLRSYNKTYGTEISIRTRKEGIDIRVYRIS